MGVVRMGCVGISNTESEQRKYKGSRHAEREHRRFNVSVAVV